ncbi:hypothetical protein [Aliiglaciecola lipolytica]|uniref:hypothetical protein n=1 Tax=Aliiglaciecola lipolytica TaxID=477689 RepID=UPI001C09D60D|nr:hypothetical protein [Aliiglaciecola lipolytica]MBU2876325.1 hypothetical protein [Aliiglaciecola lipolytica]
MKQRYLSLLVFLGFCVEASDSKPVIAIFDRKIELPSNCVRNIKQSNQTQISYYCSANNIKSDICEVIVTANDFNQSIISNLVADLSLDSNSYRLNQFKVSELSKKDSNTAFRIYTSICNADACITIFGNYQTVVSDIKQQLR